MALFSEVWFWFLVIAIILFIIALVIFAFRGSSLPGWFWFVLILSAAFIIGAIIIYLARMPRPQPRVVVLPPPVVLPPIPCIEEKKHCLPELPKPCPEPCFGAKPFVPELPKPCSEPCFGGKPFSPDSPRPWEMGGSYGNYPRKIDDLLALM